MAEYDNVSTTALKLKGASSHSIKKKKKKKEKELRKKAELMKSEESQEIQNSGEARDSSDTKSAEPAVVIKKTKAELSFLNSQKKRQAERLMEKASKTHKERIMEFNQRLDSLTEHFDIPKVSWTK
ncbi:protein FAM32A-like [Tubulanus polymorphus]|uniref:protein FAM32A-like n=1 Tax=Tubulanus polymorphus TaxID=672921 RepID=UPI003DA626E7